MHTDNLRKSYMARHPLPGGVYWDDAADRYAGKPGWETEGDLYQSQWIGWRTALEDHLHLPEPTTFAPPLIERQTFVTALQGQAELTWNALSGEFASVATQKLWETWQRSASARGQHWLPYPAIPPAQEGHYDAWSPEDGRYADAYYDHDGWFSEYDGEPLTNITHYQSEITTPIIPCRLCGAPATTHMTFGHAITRWPGTANGWYCDTHKTLSALQIKDELAKTERITTNNKHE